MDKTITYRINPTITRNEDNTFEINFDIKIPAISDEVIKNVTIYNENNRKEIPSTVSDIADFVTKKSKIIDDLDKLNIVNPELSIDDVIYSIKKFIEIYPDTKLIFANILNFMISSHQHMENDDNIESIFRIFNYNSPIFNLKTEDLPTEDQLNNDEELVVDDTTNNE